MSEFFVAPDRTQTDRFVVRSYFPGDEQAMRDAVRASYEHLRQWMPWPKLEQTVAESQELVRRFRSNYLLGTDFTLGIWSPDESRIIGGAGIHLREGPITDRQAEIGMWLAKDHAGQGLGTIVLQHLLRWGFSDAWGFVRMSWKADARNIASIRCAEKAGMVHEGILRGQADGQGGRRDTACYAALANEWPPD